MLSVILTDAIGHTGLVPCLRNYIYRKHRGALNASSSVGPLEQIEDDVVRSIDDGDDDEDDVQERCMQRHDLETLMSGLKRHVALFVLNIQEKHLLPKLTQDTIVTNVQFILQFFQRHYTDIIKFHLSCSGFKLKDHKDLDDLLSNDTVFDSAFEYVLSDYKLQQYCKEHLHFVEPVHFYCLMIQNSIKVRNQEGCKYFFHNTVFG